jgi:hypothetical protein
MSNLTAKYQWGLIIGIYVISRILKGLATSFESLQPILVPILILLTIAAFSTWVIGPISNLFLRLNPYGKYLLDKEEKLSSNFVGISLFICIGGFILYALLSNPGWLIVGLFGFAMMVPLGSMLTAEDHKNKMIAYTAAMFILGALAIFKAFSAGVPFNIFTTIFIVAFIAFQWIANYFHIRQSNV